MSYLIDIEARLGAFSLKVDLDSEKMNAGRVLALLGPSGSGKTMTLRYVAGTAKPDRGRIVVNGTTFFDSEAGIWLRPQERRVGYLFQNYALFPNMTVLENIETGITGAMMQEKLAGKRHAECAQRASRKERREKAAGWAARVHLEGVLDRRPGQQSGGQQQRCALARILAGNPQIVLLDEPFSALDEYLRDELMAETMGVLEKLRIPVLFVTHSSYEARQASTGVAVIYDGAIMETGKTEDVYSTPASEWGKILTHYPLSDAGLPAAKPPCGYIQRT